MKTFYATLSAFAVMLIIILANAFYVKSTARELSARLYLFLEEEYSQADFEELAAYWKKRRPIIELSIPAEAVWSIDEHLTEMESAAAFRNSEDIDTAARLALNAILRMECLEGFSVGSVL